MENEGSVPSKETMVKRSKSATQREIPIELYIAEILPKLPARCLLRLKCVNKFFNDLISSKEFINDHLRQSLSSDTNRLLIIRNNYGVEGLYSLDLDSRHPPARYLSLPEPFCCYPNYVDVVGCCNGLLCLRSPYFTDPIDEVEILIFNPSTKIFNSDIYRLNLVGSMYIVHYGFGYDRISDDYKVVVVYFYRHGNGFCSLVKVCGLKNNAWRCTDKGKRYSANYASRWRRLPANGVLIDSNLLHWVNLYLPYHDKAAVIDCFNLEREAWADDVPLPDSDDIAWCSQYLNLGLFDGCLCLSIRNNGLSSPTDVWVMKEYGVRESWMKLLIVAPSCNYTPLFSIRKKELLLSKDWPHTSKVGTYVWYNFEDQTTRIFEFSGAAPYFHVLALSVGSLVDVHGGRQVKEATRE